MAVINEARSCFHAYLTKHANRTVTTEHIRRQTKDGTWYDRSTYQIPPYTQHELWKIMTMAHQADFDGLHTVEDMADAQKTPYTRRPTIKGTQTSGINPFSCYPNPPAHTETTNDECNGQQYKLNGEVAKTKGWTRY